jgi:tetratricopeptide (TPR) repeat protein
MIDQHPEKITDYKPLIVYGCLNAGGSAANEGNFDSSKKYFLLASDFAPEDMVVRQNLARSYQQLSQYNEAIDNYLYVLQNSTQNTEGLLETAVCLIECFYENNERDIARQLIFDLIMNINSQPEEAQSNIWDTINNILQRDNANPNLQKSFILSGKSSN